MYGRQLSPCQTEYTVGGVVYRNSMLPAALNVITLCFTADRRPDHNTLRSHSCSHGVYIYPGAFAYYNIIDFQRADFAVVIEHIQCIGSGCQQSAVFMQARQVWNGIDVFKAVVTSV